MNRLLTFWQRFGGLDSATNSLLWARHEISPVGEEMLIYHALLTHWYGYISLIKRTPLYAKSFKFRYFLEINKTKIKTKPQLLLKCGLHWELLEDTYLHSRLASFARTGIFYFVYSKVWSFLTFSLPTYIHCVLLGLRHFITAF